MYDTVVQRKRIDRSQMNRHFLHSLRTGSVWRGKTTLSCGCTLADARTFCSRLTRVGAAQSSTITILFNRYVEIMRYQNDLSFGTGLKICTSSLLGVVGHQRQR